jgi:hypothetical protein
MDWQRQHVFGNLHETDIVTVLKSGEMQARYEQLSHGQRRLDLCQRCDTSRGEAPDGGRR